MSGRIKEKVVPVSFFTEGMKLMNFKTLFLRILFILIFFAAPFVYGDYSSYSVSELKTMEAKVLKNLAVYQKKVDNERKIKIM